MSTKVISSFSIDPKILEAFNKAKGFNSKSALVEYWITQYLKNKEGFAPITVQTQDDSTPSKRRIS